MPKFLIEVTHEPEPIACLRTVKEFLASGSHYLTHAEWGCMDGDHRSWMIVDVADKHEALGILPPMLRASARIIGLNRFSLAQVDELLSRHGSAAS